MCVKTAFLIIEVPNNKRFNITFLFFNFSLTAVARIFAADISNAGTTALLSPLCFERNRMKTASLQTAGQTKSAAQLSSLAASMFATMVVFSTFSAVAQTVENSGEKVKVKVITVQDGKTVTTTAQTLEEAKNNPAIREALEKANIDLNSFDASEGKTLNFHRQTTAADGKSATIIVEAGTGDSKSEFHIVNCATKHGATIITSGSGDNSISAECEAFTITDDGVTDLADGQGKAIVWTKVDGATVAGASSLIGNTVLVKVDEVDVSPDGVEKKVIVRVNRQAEESAPKTTTLTRSVVITRSGGSACAEAASDCKVKAVASCSPKGGSAGKSTVISKELKPSNGNIIELSAYPNPTQGEFTLTFSAKNAAVTTISVTDMAGRRVYMETLDNFSGDYTKVLNLSGEAKGNYLVKVAQGTSSAVANVVIE